MVWREQMSVGNNVIDNDHKRLIEMINGVEECLRAKDEEKLTTLFDDLSAYAKEHFRYEERLSREVGYLGAHILRNAHDILLKELDIYKNETKDQWSEEAIDEFCILLRKWLVVHVMKEDMLIKPYFLKYSPDFALRKD